MVRFLIAGAALALASAPVAAEGVASVAVTGGTLGVGPQIGYRGANVGVRADATFLGFSHTFHSSDLDYDGHAKLRSAGAMLDLYPFGGGFRLSAGARYNGNKARVVATPTQDTSIGGATFTPAQIGTLRGHGNVRDVAPALTLGYAGPARRGFLYGIEGGALFEGRVHVSSLTSSTGLLPQERLDSERASLQHDVGKYKIFPIAQLILGWRF